MEEKYKIHAFYILLILASIIIGLITVEWSEVEGLTEYITFALTVFSLGLAMIAIIYSIYSNTEFSRNLRSLEISSSKLSETSLDLSSSTAELSDKIDLIPEVLKDVSHKIDKTHTLISKIPAKAYQGTPGDGKVIDISDELIDHYFAHSSFLGLLSIYIAKKFYILDRKIDFGEVCKYSRTDFQYIFSYFIASNAFGLIKHGIVDDEIKITYINEHLSENIEIALENKIIELTNNVILKRDNLDLQVKNVDDYFMNI